MGSVDEFLSKYGDQAKAAGAIIALIVVVGGGCKWLYDRLESLEDAVEEVQSLQVSISKLQSRLEILERALPASELYHEKALLEAVEATRERFLEDERAAAELRGTVIALITEVRVRHGQPGYVALMPSGGHKAMSQGSELEQRVDAQIKQNRAAAEALDMSLARTIMTIPQKTPLSSLDYLRTGP